MGHFFVEFTIDWNLIEIFQELFGDFFDCKGIADLIVYFHFFCPGQEIVPGGVTTQSIAVSYDDQQESGSGQSHVDSSIVG